MSKLMFIVKRRMICIGFATNLTRVCYTFEFAVRFEWLTTLTLKTQNTPTLAQPLPLR